MLDSVAQVVRNLHFATSAVIQVCSKNISAVGKLVAEVNTHPWFYPYKLTVRALVTVLFALAATYLLNFALMQHTSTAISDSRLAAPSCIAPQSEALQHRHVSTSAASTVLMRGLLHLRH